MNTSLTITSLSASNMDFDFDMQSVTDIESPLDLDIDLSDDATLSGASLLQALRERARDVPVAKDDLLAAVSGLIKLTDASDEAEMDEVN